MYLTFPYLGQITYKIQFQMQGLGRVLDLNCKQKEEWAI